MRGGTFITIEGGDGSGKSTAIQAAVKHLESAGYEVVVTREPGGIRIAEQIRQVILNVENTEMDPRTEALLYAAARRQHLVERIRPALDAGKIVICDRFVDSSLAYQGYARGLGIDEVLAINNFAIDQFMPDLTIYLDVSPEVALGRIHANSNREVNRLDLESIEFHKKVQEGYYQLFERFPGRIVRVNADASEGEVGEDIITVLRAHL